MASRRVLCFALGARHNARLDYGAPAMAVAMRWALEDGAPDLALYRQRNVLAVDRTARAC